MIEATGPALQPVAALRRFVVKSRVDVVMAPLVDRQNRGGSDPAAANAAKRREAAAPRRPGGGGSRRQAAT